MALSKPHCETEERIPIFRWAGDDDIDSGVELQISRHAIGQTCVEGADPIGVRLGSDGAEKLDVTGQVLDQFVLDRDTVNELGMVAALVLAARGFESSRQAEVEVQGQRHIQR